MSRKTEKVVCRASYTRFYSRGFREKEFFNTHACYRQLALEVAFAEHSEFEGKEHETTCGRACFGSHRSAVSDVAYRQAALRRTEGHRTSAARLFFTPTRNGM